jgi:myo-inositol-1(or 4)-monophosphatase
MADFLAIAREAALLAGHYLKANFGHQIASANKESHHSIVTAHDIEAERLIIDLLKSKFPKHGILSEEIGLINGDAGYIWAIDPLDGSSYYARGIETFSVSVGLMHKYELIAAAIYLPMQDELFSAEKGKGAYLNDKRISVSSVAHLKEATGTFGHRYLRLAEYDRGMRNLLTSVRAVRGGGSCAMELCYLACGRIDVLLTVNQSSWDYAAGALIVSEAGGKISDIKGAKTDLHKYLMSKYDLLATNQLLHKNVLDSIRL